MLYTRIYVHNRHLIEVYTCTNVCMHVYVHVHVHVIGKCVFADVLIKVTRNVLMLNIHIPTKKSKLFNTYH